MYPEFGKAFEGLLVGQAIRKTEASLTHLRLAGALLRMLPREELDRIDTKILDVYYDKKDADTDSDKKQA